MQSATPKTAIVLEQAVGQQFLLTFEGREAPPQQFLDVLRRQHVGGVVLFRHKNMSNLAELHGLTHILQRAAAQAGQPPLLIAADQEGGQLMAVDHTTPFPGNMALGAAGSDKLAYKVGRALGKELSAVGINVDFAPVCDVNSNPQNPVIGTRSFGENPKLVARLSAALIRGLQSAGIAATAKHFPGHGDTSSDSHHKAPVVMHDAKRIRSVELVPFRAAMNSRVRLVMTAHIVVPALNGGSNELPATLSPRILRDLLRRKMGFNGVIVSDALDMHAMEQGPGYVAEAMAAVAAGIDLLIFNHDLSRVEPAWSNLAQAARRGLLSADEIHASARRIMALKSWIKRQPQEPLSVIGCDEHMLLAQEVARKSITLVRDTAGQLPLAMAPEEKIAVVIPRPEDLTPADTSSYVKPVLADALRRYHPRVDEFSFSMSPAPSEIGVLCQSLAKYDVAILGTINATAHPTQAELANKLIKQGTRVITVALRMPYDLAAYPEASTYICTYSILPPAMEALAEALFGRIAFTGALPVTIPGKSG
ncbi:MAG TPA: glycoside hydrolase family 3 N-terminal domain-containing protein [Alphaproteobacteria bacterium]|nr:glycoside hydrolase family 3 N-terminal domain-containing protein [Alphaproteobacteria bacterium]